MSDPFGGDQPTPGDIYRQEAAAAKARQKLAEALDMGDPERGAGKRRKKRRSPNAIGNDLTNRTIEEEQAFGRFAFRVDRSINTGMKVIAEDLLGFADILSLADMHRYNGEAGTDLLAIQCTTLGAHTAHERKLFAGEPIRQTKATAYDLLERWMACGGRFAMRLWYKQTNGRWASKNVEYTTADIRARRAQILAKRRQGD